MKREPSIRLYALAVCFVSVICVAITAGFALYNGVKLAAPELTIEPYRIQNLMTNEAFVSNPGLYPRPMAIGPDGVTRALDTADPFAGMSEAQITQRRLERLHNEIDMHRRSAIQSLLRQGIIILVAAVLYFCHWRLARRIGAGPDAPGDT